MTGHRLGRTAWRLWAENFADRATPHQIVQFGRGAMQIDVVDLLGLQMSSLERTHHRKGGTLPFRMRRAYVVSVRAFAHPEQRHRTLPGGHEENRRAFADIDSVAIAAERIAVVAGQGAERIKATQRHAAKC